MSSEIEEMAEESSAPLSVVSYKTTYKIAYIEGARDLLDKARQLAKPPLGSCPMVLLSDLEALFAEKKEAAQDGKS